LNILINLFKLIYFILSKIKMSRTKTGNNYDHLFRYIIVGDTGT